MKNISLNNELHGIWRLIPSTAISEIISQSGFNFQILDCEHGPYDYNSLGNDIHASDNYECLSFIRVSGLDKVEVQRCLDLGADGIVFPQLSGFDDFEMATKLMKYAPDGVRGFNPFVRALEYGISSRTKQTKAACIVIIETLQAIRDLDRILALDGIDLVYIGSYDLSAQLGCIGEMDNPLLVSHVEEVIAKCRAAGKAIGLMINSKEKYIKYKEKGVNIFVHTVDSYLLKKTFSESIKQLSQL